jgi:molybdenum cofactor cytidylyltransferase
MMAQALIDGALAAAPVWRGRRGNPVLIDRTLFPQLLALTGDAGARGVLQDLGNRLVLVESPDDGVLFDVDHVTDLISTAHPREGGDVESRLKCNT